MHHRNSIATKTIWRLNTAAIMESPKQLRDRKNKTKAIRYTNKNPVLDHSASY